MHYINNVNKIYNEGYISQNQLIGLESAPLVSYLSIKINIYKLFTNVLVEITYQDSGCINLFKKQYIYT